MAQAIPTKSDIYNSPLFKLTPTIAASASESSAIDLSGTILRRITMPSAWTAAYVGLKASNDGGTTFGGLLRDRYGALILFTVDAGYEISVPLDLVDGISSLKLVSCDADGVAVTQAAVRTFTLVVARYAGQP